MPGRQMDLSQREIYHSGDRFVSHQHTGNKHVKSRMNRWDQQEGRTERRLKNHLGNTNT